MHSNNVKLKDRKNHIACTFVIQKLNMIYTTVKIQHLDTT